MTISEAIARCNLVKPNQFDDQTKVEWLTRLDGKVWWDVIRSHEGAPAGLTAKDALIWVDGKNLVVNGNAVDMGLSTAPEDCPKQLVGMGAWLVIWPDRKYINTADLTDYGSIDASFSVADGAQVTYTICDINGNPYNGIAYTEPQTPQGGDLWMDNHSLKRYDGTTSVWVTIPQVYVKITATGIGTDFEAYDGVVLKGIAYNGDSEEVKQQYADLNASKVIWAKGEDWIVVVGVVDRGATQTGGVSVHRIAPDMDYICQAQNRLWGCRYGVKDGKTFAALLPGFRYAGEHCLTEGMAVFVPLYRLLHRIPAIRDLSNRIVVLERG